MAALGLPQTSSLDYSSTLPSSCSAFRPLHVKLGAPRRARIVCSSSGQSQQEPASSRKSALTKLVATGLAIVISSSSGVGVSQAAVTDIRQAQTQAENLLKDADKLTNDESPPRVGPQRGFVKDEDADRVALKGGAGAIPDLQNPGSEFVGKARGKLEERTETTKQRFGEQLGKVQSKASEARENVQGFFGQAGDKATDKAGEAKDNVQGVVGDAGDRARSSVQSGLQAPAEKAGSAKENVKGFFGSAGDKIKDSVDNVDPGKTKENVKGFVGQAGDKANNALMNPAGKIGEAKDNAKGLFGQAGDKVGEAGQKANNALMNPSGKIGEATENVKGFFGQAGDKVGEAGQKAKEGLTRARSWAVRILDAARLTESGRPVLHPGEVEQLLLDAVDVESDDDAAEPIRAGLVTLTNARIVWINELDKVGFSIPLASVCRIFPPKKTIKNMFHTPRLRLQLWTSANGKVCSHGASGSDSSVALSLVFRGQGSHESFVAKLAELLQSRPWEALPSSSSASTSSSSSASSRPAEQQLNRWNPSRAGVSGILRKEQEQWEQADKDLQEAFQDLNALMGKAKDMVSLADKLRAKLISGQTSSDDIGSKQEIQDLLLSVGLVSPVTKESAGALYHQQLSRQLADFLWTPLQRAGGMLAMVDVYCLFNRARGTELISPDDLLQACSIWERIDVPVKMRQFESGALVVQTKSARDDEVFSKIMVLVNSSRNGASASDAARALGVAPALAKEHLLAAENRGLLCRDDGADGLRFFANFFKDIDISIVFHS